MENNFLTYFSLWRFTKTKVFWFLCIFSKPAVVQQWYQFGQTTEHDENLRPFNFVFQAAAKQHHSVLSIVTPQSECLCQMLSFKNRVLLNRLLCRLLSPYKAFALSPSTCSPACFWPQWSSWFLILLDTEWKKVWSTVQCTFIPLGIQTLSVWILLCLRVTTEEYVEMSEVSHVAWFFWQTQNETWKINGDFINLHILCSLKVPIHLDNLNSLYQKPYTETNFCLSLVNSELPKHSPSYFGYYSIKMSRSVLHVL